MTNPTEALIRRLEAEPVLQADQEPFVEIWETDYREILSALSHIEGLEKALRRLSFAAQTSGGTAGRDENLVAAIEEARAALNIRSEVGETQ